jgi:hypothetical protein
MRIQILMKRVEIHQSNLGYSTHRLPQIPEGKVCWLGYILL